jgi:hypothetical protein
MDNYYVYIFLDQRKSGSWIYKNHEFKYQPFYVGKGKQRRLISHFNDSSLNSKSHKNSLIKKIINNTGELPIHIRLYENLSENNAFEIERDLINFFGRKSDGGILANETLGGEGHSGYNYPKIYKRKIYYQYDLNGNFIKKWNSCFEIQNELNIRYNNISTSIKRNGTCGGFIWKKEFCGKNLKLKKKKYQMPIKYVNIKQININNGEIIDIHENALIAEEKLKLRSGSRNKIIECIKGNLKTAYGFKWEI